MTLENYITQNDINQTIVVLMLDERSDFESYEYQNKEFETIPQCFKDMEVMETIQENDLLEIWVK